MRKKRSSQDAPELKRFINSVRGASGTGDLRRGLSRAREELSPPFYASALSWLKSNTYYGHLLFGNAFPASTANLHQALPLKRLSEIAEVQWSIALLSQEQERLTDFIGLRTKYETAIAQSNYADASKLLTDIESVCGQSLWLIKQRIAIAQETRGLEGQKRYASSVIREGGAFAPFIAHFTSVKCEPTVMLASFELSLRKELLSQDVSPETETYLLYHLLAEYPPTVEEMVASCRIEATSSWVDLYEAVIACFRVLATRRREPRDDWRGLVRYFFRRFSEPRTQALHRSLTREAAVEPSAMDLRVEEAVSLLRAGKLEASERKLLDVLSLGMRYDAMLLISWLRAITQRSSVSDPPLTGRIVDDVASLFLATEQSTERLVALRKLAATWSSLEIGAVTRALVSRAMAVDPLEPIETERIAAVTLNECAAFDWRIPHSSRRNADTNDLQRNVQVAEGYASNHVAATQRTLAKCHADAVEDRWDLVEHHAQTLVHSDWRAYRVEGYKYLLRAYVEQQAELRAALLVTSAVVKERTLPVALPLELTARRLLARDDREDHRELAAAVLYDLAAKHYGEQFEAVRNFAHEDFLLLNGMSRPSDTATRLLDFDRETLVYYLRFVCVESVLATSTIYNTSVEVGEERAAICRVLMDLDPANQAIYEGELRDILRRLTVRKRLREIEQSKIYVGVDEIRAIAATQLKEPFARYIALSSLDDALMAEFRRVIEQLNAQIAERGGVVAFALPVNELDAVFTSMVTLVRDEFLFNVAHGLDSYLSTRIRHGTLAGELRAPLEAAHLITTRDASGTHKSNQYWLRAAPPLPPVAQTKYDRMFTDFSVGYDALVDRIRADWVQVRRDAQGKGKFDFVLKPDRIRLIRQGWQPPHTPETLADAVIQQLYQMLDASLASMRSALRSEAKVEAMSLLNKLEADAAALGLYFDTTMLTTAVRAGRTEVQRAFDRVEEWFNLSRGGTTDPFVAEDAINIAMYMSRTTEALDITVEVPANVTFRGDRLNALVDVLMNVFENVKKHSALERPRTTVTIELESEDVRFSVASEVARGVRSEAAVADVARTRSSLDDPAMRKHVSREGKSGFRKIWKLLVHDLQAVEPRFAFDFVGDEAFEVSFVVPMKGLLHEDGIDS